MKGKRHTSEERIRILRKAEPGKSAQEGGREHGISEQTFYRWRKEWERSGHDCTKCSP